MVVKEGMLPPLNPGFYYAALLLARPLTNQARQIAFLGLRSESQIK